MSVTVAVILELRFEGLGGYQMKEHSRLSSQQVQCLGRNMLRTERRSVRLDFKEENRVGII